MGWNCVVLIPYGQTAIHRQAISVAQRVGWPVLSYSTVSAVVQHLDPALVTLAHDGPTAYQQRFGLLHRPEADHLHAIWQADHTRLDVWEQDDRDPPVRSWLTVILDDYSRAVVGYRLSLVPPSALHTALAKRDAIRREPEPAWHVCGLPDLFDADHGSDFTSRFANWRLDPSSLNYPFLGKVRATMITA